MLGHMPVHNLRLFQQSFTPTLLMEYNYTQNYAVYLTFTFCEEKKPNKGQGCANEGLKLSKGWPQNGGEPISEGQRGRF
jgi:hypothetical protein